MSRRRPKSSSGSSRRKNKSKHGGEKNDNKSRDAEEKASRMRMKEKQAFDDACFFDVSGSAKRSRRLKS